MRASLAGASLAENSSDNWGAHSNSPVPCQIPCHTALLFSDFFFVVRFVFLLPAAEFFSCLFPRCARTLELAFTLHIYRLAFMLQNNYHSSSIK
jgi:hypothetical protein